MSKVPLAACKQLTLQLVQSMLVVGAAGQAGVQNQLDLQHKQVCIAFYVVSRALRCQHLSVSSLLFPYMQLFSFVASHSLPTCVSLTHQGLSLVNLHMALTNWPAQFARCGCPGPMGPFRHPTALRRQPGKKKKKLPD